MADASLPATPSPTPPPFSLIGGLLSYLIPGLGQIAQGRVGKGLLFLVCIYTLFFYGVYLGMGSIQIEGTTYTLSGNVYLPTTPDETPREKQLPALAQNLYNRPQFAGQFWVGIAAWPAIIQYLHEDDGKRLRREIQQLRQVDPTAAERKREELDEREKTPGPKHPVLGNFMSEPDPMTINAVHNAGDKRLELAWVYTVIAGVLNILVIYDAIAGPAFGSGVSAPHGKD